jgi:hypothetical protein
VEPLLQHRQEQGLAALAVPLQVVYDQFGGGNVTPEAIRGFLRYSTSNWDPAPRYVLLLGDATYDPLGKIYPVEGNILPTFFIETNYGGQTASDILMAQVNDPELDPWPDLAIGRFPARTAAQVETLVEKTLLFEEQLPRADWRNRVLAVADNQEAYFAEDARQFLEGFREPFQPELYAPSPGETGVNQQISGKITEGVYLLAYFGHGSLKIWGKEALYSREDSSGIQNSPDLPLILNFTCLTGLFTHPVETSLAESFLWNPQGGAAAVLAPSSLTLPLNQSTLSDEIARALSDPEITRLGDIILSAWRAVPADTPDSRDVMTTFMLFGDPALLIVSP